jgi:hypothetical protein
MFHLLVGMFLRIGFCLGFGALLHATVEGFDLLGFVLWLMLLYLFTLALEVRFLVMSIGMAPKA